MCRRLLVVLAAAAWAVPARAHALVVASDPAHRAHVPQGQRTLVVRFNSRIDRARSRLTLIRPDGSQEVLALLPGPEDALSAAAVLGEGAHTLRWQVLAVDGHITRGDVPFSVAAP